MAAVATRPTVSQHFLTRDPVVRQTYDALLAAARRLGPFTEDPKKSSIHLNRTTPFAGVTTRTSSLMLTLKAAADIDDARIVKHEQASPTRWHLDVRLSAPSDVDAQVERWLANAYALSV